MHYNIKYKKQKANKALRSIEVQNLLRKIQNKYGFLNVNIKRKILRSKTTMHSILHTTAYFKAY